MNWKVATLAAVCLGAIVAEASTDQSQPAPESPGCAGECCDCEPGLTEQAVLALIEKHCKSCTCASEAPSGAPQEPDVSENEVLEAIKAPVAKQSVKATCVGGSCTTRTIQRRGLFGWRR